MLNGSGLLPLDAVVVAAEAAEAVVAVRARLQPRRPRRGLAT